jgi:hypothetical protein
LADCIANVKELNIFMNLINLGKEFGFVLERSNAIFIN